ncbi:MAG TPA: YdeI/OmpD-associated family protein [Gammaproteobacteria bacterium]|nr:YdeI/OmpD-associated family protein [Gammaproteobacteria bacterium]
MKSRIVLKRFSAVIVLVRAASPEAINPCVVVPAPIVAALRAESGKNQSLPVRVTVQGKPLKANVMRYLGAWRLYLNGTIRKAAGVDVGDRVRISLRHDPAPRREKMPKVFAAALARDAKARAAFEALAPSRRKELLRYLNNLKREESVQRNLAKMLRYLKGQQTGASPKGLYRT